MTNKDNTAQDTTSDFDGGAEVYLGFGNTVTFYPLTWGAMRALKSEWKTVFDPALRAQRVAGDEVWEDAVAKVLFASARRGNADLTETAFLNMLDMRNLPACFRALSVASGLKRVEEAKPGDAVRPTEAPTGATSTPPLSPAPAGPMPSAIN